MEYKFYPSSPTDRSMKRCLDDELAQSPSAKRAKRVRNRKKRQNKSEKEENGYIEQEDWVTFDGLATSSPASWKQSPVKPPTPFPLRLAHKSQTMNSANKTYREPQTEDELKGAKNTTNNSRESMNRSADQDSPKAEANTRKTRVETEPPGEIKYPIDNGDFKIPAIAGPSETRTEARITAEDYAQDSSPSSDIAAPVDYTFKAFPNPVSSPFTSIKPEPTEQHDSADDEPTATETQVPITLPAGAAPAGTKTLKAINKHLKALEAKLAAGPANTNTETATETDTQNALGALRSDIAHLRSRLDCAELRAAARHEMLFNALVKVSTDVCALRSAGEQVVLEQQQQHVDGHGHGNGHGNGRAQQQDGEDGPGVENESVGMGGGSPRKAMSAAAAKDKRMAGLKQSRKTLEQCLRSFSEDMERAEDEELVRRYGVLCVQYAGDLFKTLG